MYGCGSLDRDVRTLRAAGMRIESAAGRDVPLGAVFGAVLALGGLVAAVWFRLGLPRPVCLFHEWTGLPCPGCGSTRMLERLLSGDVVGALAWNPLAFMALVAVAAWSPASTVRWALGRPPRRIVLTARRALALRIAAGALVAAGWGYLLWRGV